MFTEDTVCKSARNGIRVSHYVSRGAQSARLSFEPNATPKPSGAAQHSQLSRMTFGSTAFEMPGWQTS